MRRGKCFAEPVVTATGKARRQLHPPVQSELAATRAPLLSWVNSDPHLYCRLQTHVK